MKRVLSDFYRKYANTHHNDIDVSNYENRLIKKGLSSYILHLFIKKLEDGKHLVDCNDTSVFVFTKPDGIRINECNDCGYFIEKQDLLQGIDDGKCEYENLQQEVSHYKTKVKSRRNWTWFLIASFVFLLTTIVAISLYSINEKGLQHELEISELQLKDLKLLTDSIEISNDLVKLVNDKAVSDVELFNKSIKKFKREISESKTQIDEIKRKYPISVYSVSIGNADKNSKVITLPGYSVSAYYAEYLRPKVKYFVIDNSLYDKNITLGIKIYSPQRRLLTNIQSTYSYTYFSTMAVNRSHISTLKDWGYGEKGSFKSGQYKIEFWYDDKIIGRGEFWLF